MSALPVNAIPFDFRFHIDLPARLPDAVRIIPVNGDTISADIALLPAHRTLITSFLKNQTGFQGEWGQTAFVPTAAGDLILLGLKPKAGLIVAAAEWEMLGGALAGALRPLMAQDVLFPFPLAAQAITHVLAGLVLGSYRYRTTPDRKKSKTPKKRTVHIVSSHAKKAEALWRDHGGVVTGILTVRDLVNTPPNLLYPAAFADRIQSLLKPLGVKVTVLDDKDLKRERCNLILAVGGGASRAHQPRLVIMEWPGRVSKGSQKTSAYPLALVGKGITFDTGGYSLKPPPSMPEMIMDMGGAASVVGTMQALALGRVDQRVVGIVALAENMVSGEAYRPSDVIISRKGLSVEILNTDAEGRLVLADAMHYVQDHYKPKTMIDLATLTGAILVALGPDYAGLFGNDDRLIDHLRRTASGAGEKCWPMPLDQNFRDAMKGSTSDLKNISGWDRYGGSCTAAAFLQAFVEDGVAWAHFDIAGAAWETKGKPNTPKGGTGWGVRSLVAFAQDYNKFASAKQKT